MLWDVNARRELKRATEGRASLGALSTDGSLLVTPDAAIVGVRQLELLDAPNGPIECLALSADALRAIACQEQWRAKGFERWRSGVFELWDSERQELRRWPRGSGDVATLSDDGRHVLIRRSNANELRRWSNGQLLLSTAHYMWNAAAISPDGNHVATLDLSSGMRHWWLTLRDAAAGKIIWQNKQEHPAERVLGFARDGRKLVFQDEERRLVVLSTSDGSVLRRLGPIELAQWVLVSDEQALLASEDRNMLTAYHLQSGARLWSSLEKHWRLGAALSADGKSFVALDNKTIRLRSLATGKDLGERIDLEPSADQPRHLAASSDGTTLLVGTERGVLLRFRLRPQPAAR